MHTHQFHITRPDVTLTKNRHVTTCTHRGRMTSLKIATATRHVQFTIIHKNKDTTRSIYKVWTHTHTFLDYHVQQYNGNWTLPNNTFMSRSKGTGVNHRVHITTTKMYHTMNNMHACNCACVCGNLMQYSIKMNKTNISNDVMADSTNCNGLQPIQDPSF